MFLLINKREVQILQQRETEAFEREDAIQKGL